MNARRRKPRRGVFGWTWRLLLVVLFWLVGVAAYITWVGQRDDARPADAIIVLGAAAYDAKPSPVFEERIRHGIDLYKRGLAPKLIFTGGYGGVGARFSESQVARRYALRQGVPDKAILIESLSRNTHDNLRQASLLMQQHQQDCPHHHQRTGRNRFSHTHVHFLFVTLIHPNTDTRYVVFDDRSRM